MTDNSWRKPGDIPEPTSRRGEPFSLETYLDRQWADFATGPTMAELLARADARRSRGVPRETIAAIIREDREGRA